MSRKANFHHIGIEYVFDPIVGERATQADLNQLYKKVFNDNGNVRKTEAKNLWKRLSNHPKSTYFTHKTFYAALKYIDLSVKENQDFLINLIRDSSAFKQSLANDLIEMQNSSQDASHDEMEKELNIKPELVTRLIKEGVTKLKRVIEESYFGYQLISSLASSGLMNHLFRSKLDNFTANIALIALSNLDLREQMSDQLTQDLGVALATYPLKKKTVNNFHQFVLKTYTNPASMPYDLAQLIVTNPALWKKFNPDLQHNFIKRFLNYAFGWFETEFVAAREELIKINPKIFAAKLGAQMIAEHSIAPNEPIPVESPPPSPRGDNEAIVESADPVPVESPPSSPLHYDEGMLYSALAATKNTPFMLSSPHFGEPLSSTSEIINTHRLVALKILPPAAVATPITPPFVKQRSKSLSQLSTPELIGEKNNQCKDYYQVLGIARNSTALEIKAMGSTLLLAIHPDKSADYAVDGKPSAEKILAKLVEGKKISLYSESQLLSLNNALKDLVDNANAFKDIQYAVELLTNDNRRSEYDQLLTQQPARQANIANQLYLRLQSQFAKTVVPVPLAESPQIVATPKSPVPLAKSPQIVATPKSPVPLAESPQIVATPKSPVPLAESPQAVPTPSLPVSMPSSSAGCQNDLQSIRKKLYFNHDNYNSNSDSEASEVLENFTPFIKL